MLIGDLIAIFALLLSVISLLISPSRFELGNNYRVELINWYEKTEEIIKRLYLSAYNDDLEKRMLLAQLSTQIEVGRFYFPNSPSSSDSKSKPLAYRGNRHIALSCLVNIYQAYYSPDAIKPYLKGRYPSIESYVDNRAKKFTSIIYKIVSPKNWNKSRDFFTNAHSPENYDEQDIETIIGKNR